MANVYIKTVNGGEATTLGAADGIEIDTGTESKWISGDNLAKTINGMSEYIISVTVSGNDLIVALKNKNGDDPSATSPIHLKIGSSTRSVTAALSRTLADGTNWFNSGSAALGTKEIDYFAYVVWDSNSSAVGLSFARIPNARLVSDFSSTTTNEKYCAGYSDFTSTDEVMNIGRFAATLSLSGTSHLWTTPTATNVNLIQHPIFTTRSLTWAGVVTSGTGAPTNPTSTTGTYIIDNNRMFLSVVIAIVTKGTAAGNLLVAGPFVPTAAYALSAGENLATGVTCNANYQTTPRIAAVKYDATTLWVDGYNIVASGWVLI